MATATMQQVRFTAGNLSLAAWTSGDHDATPVLFLHGTSANGRVWDDVVREVTTPIWAMSLDQRGHGLSDHGDDYTADAFVEDAVAVLGHVKRPALVVGHSMGARNAWVLAARRPDLVVGVLAVDYTPYVETEVLDALDVRVRAGNRAWQTREEVEAYLRDRYPRLPESAVARRAEFGYAVMEDGLLRPLAHAEGLAQLVEGLRADFPQEYASLTVPMTSVRGEDSLIVSPETWAAAKTLAPHVNTVEVAGADHYVHEEQPAVVARCLDQMLSDTIHS